MTTYILGASGQLGGVVWRHSKRAGTGWKGQARQSGFDVKWDGRFDRSHPPVLQEGATLINMIGGTGHQREDLTALNVDFVRDLLERAANAGVAHVILASSAAVYGNGTGAPFEEDAALAPLTPYGRSKAAMEDVAHDLVARNASPPVTILRIANVAGSDALTSVARSASLEGKPMSIHRFPSGKAALRSYIGPKDLFDCVSALSANTPDGIQTFNICAPAPVRLDALLSSYQSALFPGLTFTDEPAPDGIPEEVVLSTKKLETIISLDQSTSQPNVIVQQVVEDQEC